MKLKIALIVGWVIFTFILFSCQSTAPKKKEAVLFIGNSYTYRNKGVDQHLAELNSSINQETKDYSRAAQGKFHLKTHYFNTKTKEKWSERKWDAVVLQEYSSGPMLEQNQFNFFGKKWAKKIKAKNPKAKIYLYATWGYRRTEQMTDSLYNAYSLLAKEIDATVIPVGKMWQQVQRKVNLYDGDGAHPNRKGTFLTACLFYEYLEGKDVRKTKHTDTKLPKWLQKKLKRLAHEFHSNWVKNGEV